MTRRQVTFTEAWLVDNDNFEQSHEMTLTSERKWLKVEWTERHWKQMIEIAGKFLLIVKCLGATKQLKTPTDSKD